MNMITEQTMTMSSPNLLNRIGDAKFSCYIGYNVKTQNISVSKRKNKVPMKEDVKSSLEQSLKDNADIWSELSKH